MMSNLRVLLWAASVVLGTVTVGSAEEEGVSFSTTADVFSKYVWRGQNVVDDWVLQPSAGIGYKGFTASVWGNMDLHGETVDDGELNEVDYVIDYSNTFPGQEILAYSVGAIYYDFPNAQLPGTAEIYGGLSASASLSPAVTWFYDFDEADGSYIQFSVGHGVEKIAQWTKDAYCDLEVGASLAYASAGYDDYYFGVNDSALNDLTLSAGLPISVGNWTIKPIIAYSMMIDDDIRKATGKSDNLWGGINIAVEF